MDPQPTLDQPPMNPADYPISSITNLRTRLAQTIDSIAKLQDSILRSGADWSTVLPQYNILLSSTIALLRGLKNEELRHLVVHPSTGSDGEGVWNAEREGVEEAVVGLTKQGLLPDIRSADVDLLTSLNIPTQPSGGDPNIFPDLSEHQSRIRSLILAHDERIRSAFKVLSDIEDEEEYDWKTRLAPDDEEEDEEMEALFGQSEGKLKKKENKPQKRIGLEKPKMTMELLEQFVKGKNIMPVNIPPPKNVPPTQASASSTSTIQQDRKEEAPVNMEVDVGLSSAF